MGAILILFIVIQATVDISRELDWSKQTGLIRVAPRRAAISFFMIFSIALLIAGKAYFHITGIPIMGLVALYLIMMAEFMRIYPYIVCRKDEMIFCAHALSPKIVIEKKYIIAASKAAHMLVLSYQAPEEPIRIMHIDGDAFGNFVALEKWLGPILKPVELPKKIKKAA